MNCKVKSKLNCQWRYTEKSDRDVRKISNKEISCENVAERKFCGFVLLRQCKFAGKLIQISKVR